MTQLWLLRSAQDDNTQSRRRFSDQVEGTVMAAEKLGMMAGER